VRQDLKETPVPAAPLAEASQQSPVVSDGYVPVIDLGPALAGDTAARAATAAAIDRACRSSGFFTVVGHGVDRGLIDRFLAVTEEFFRAPAAIKEPTLTTPGDLTLRGLHSGGYVAASFGVETPPDLCEFYTVNRLGEPGSATREDLGDAYDTWAAPNVWPALEGFRETWLEYYAACDGLMRELMRLCALALGMPEDFFDDKVDRNAGNIIANWYPPTLSGLADQLRKGPHTDWGSLTILYQDAGGLQVRTQDGRWIDVPVRSDAFVVNIGDMLSVWTNDAWNSTVHRVPLPTGEASSTARISVPYFGMANWSTVIECLPTCLDEDGSARHAPVTCGDYFLGKLAASYG
jgi:isopenicillin N synthase-like dioxygenase